jgi:predicted AlkP superfamily phosphohydrolase/phosphomutase
VPDHPPRVLAIGLDSVSPWLLYERFLPLMPNVRKLLERSRYGTLRTIDPPITVPAWAVMFSGMDPGTLGVYGFRHRKAGTYWDNYIPTSRTILKPMVWDRLGRMGKRVCVIGMPPGYPPPAVNGVYISDFLTPDNATDYVYPPSMKAEIDRVSGGYPFDVTFRQDDRDRIGKEVFEMTRKHFAVARHLWKKEPWDLFAYHEIGPDRLHHTFWRFFDKTHPKYEENEHLRTLVEDYYRMLDEELGRFFAEVPKDVRILLVSDHGSQAMQGAFCINEWLIQQGFLTLRGPRPPPKTQIEEADVDWSKTLAWGAGGYYARIFYNVKGREPEGALAPADLPAFEARLTKALQGVRRPDGAPLGVDVRRPKDIYRSVQGDAPDLMVYFGDVAWRSIGTIGYPTLFIEENDTGPDDAVHSFEGIYSISDPAEGRGQRGPVEKLMDIAPTVLSLLGAPVPPEMQGKAIAGFR